jgi:hypothetical protein
MDLPGIRRPGSVLLAVTVALSLLIAGCGGGTDASEPNQVSGVVSQVSGPGDIVDGFVIVDDGGASHAFVPAAGLTCDGQPLNHLRTHLIDRDRVVVSYEIDSGPPTATVIRHDGG